MAEEFVGVEVAGIIVIASITLAGILVGVGQAMGSKKLEQFGIEELVQSIINAAIIGSFAAIVEVVATLSSSVVVDSCSTGNAIVQLICTLNGLNSSIFILFQELTYVLNIIGYYQSLSLDFGAFAISPFTNLSSISNLLSLQALGLNLIMMVGQLNAQIATFIGQNALGLIFPVGLVLRTLFATRKLGGFLIALAIGLYVLYPMFILIFPSPADTVDQSALVMQNFTSNPYYATVPVIDLNDNYAIAAKLDMISGRCDFEDSEFYVNGTMTNVTTATVNGTTVYITIGENGTACDSVLYEQGNYTGSSSADMTGDLTVISQANNNAIAQAALYNAIAPLFSLIITIVFIKEMASILGSEIGVKSFVSI